MIILEILFEAKDISADNLIDNIKWANFVKKQKTGMEFWKMVFLLNSEFLISVR